MKTEHTLPDKIKTHRGGPRLAGFEYPVNALILLAIACLALYMGTLRSPFIFDNIHTIVENPYITSIKSLPDYVFKGRETIDRIENAGWRPLWFLSFILNYSACGLNPFGYHLTNVFIHFLDCALVYALALLLLNGRAKKPWLGALAAALLFAVNPVHTESVSYIVSRSALMAAFFYAGAFCFYVLYRGAQGAEIAPGEPNTIKYKTLYAVCCMLFFILGMLSKENVVTFPLMALAYDLLIKRDAREPDGGTARTRMTYGLAVVLFAIAAAFTAVILYYIRLGGAHHASARGLMEHWKTEVYVVRLYILKSLLPFNLNLDPDVRMIMSFRDPKFWLSLFALCLIFFGLYRLYRRDRLAAFLGLWFFVALITETVAPITDFYAEHRLYLPLIGPAILAGMWFEKLITDGRYGRHRYVFSVLLVCILSLMAAATLQRNRVYADELAIWSDTAAKSPGKARPHMALALALWHCGKKEAAYAEFKRTLAIEPDDGYALFNTAMLLCDMHREGEALHYAKKAVRVLPDFYSLDGLGVVYARLGRKEEAKEILLKTIAKYPDFFYPYMNLGKMAMKDNRPDEALKYFRTAITLKPLNAEAHTIASSALIRLKRYREAAAEAGQALGLSPGDAAAWNMAKALEGAGDLKGAARYYSMYLTLAPRIRPTGRKRRRRVKSLGPHFHGGDNSFALLTYIPRHTPLLISVIPVQTGIQVFILSRHPGNRKSRSE